MALDNFEIIPDTVSETQEEPKLGGFQNPNYLEGPSPVVRDTFQNPCYISGDTVVVLDAVPSGACVDSDLERLANEVQEAQNDLDEAEERLQEAMDRGDSVLTLMSTVETCRGILETRQRMYNDALTNATATPLAGKEGKTTDEVKFGSVDHKRWELEVAIKNNNKIAIENRQRDLAKEIAKEAEKKAQKK